MRVSKRKKLEAAGWKLGNPKDRLGLSAEEQTYIELRLKLAGAQSPSSGAGRDTSSAGSKHKIQSITGREDGVGRSHGLSRYSAEVLTCPGGIKPGAGGDYLPTLKRHSNGTVRARRGRTISQRSRRQAASASRTPPKWLAVMTPFSSEAAHRADSKRAVPQQNLKKEHD